MSESASTSVGRSPISSPRPTTASSSSRCRRRRRSVARRSPTRCDRAPDGEPDEVLHGTTVATNAVLTRSGAELAFVTTRGLPSSAAARAPGPSVAVRPAGAPSGAARRRATLRRRPGAHRPARRGARRSSTRTPPCGARGHCDGVDGVAVTSAALLRQPGTRAARRRARRARCSVRTSRCRCRSDVLPEFREYERASTTALNAYVQPVVERYLASHRRRSRERSRVGVMWSGGGMRGIARTIAAARAHDVSRGRRPACSARRGRRERAASSDIVTLDMGGTSADVALVDDGASGRRGGVVDRRAAVPDAVPRRRLRRRRWRKHRVDRRRRRAARRPALGGSRARARRATDAAAPRRRSPTRRSCSATWGPSGLAGGELALDREAALARRCERLGEPAGLIAIGCGRGCAPRRARDDGARDPVGVGRARQGRAAVRARRLRRRRAAARDRARPRARDLDGRGPAGARRARRARPPRRVAARRRVGVASDAAEPARDGELRSILHELTERCSRELRAEGSLRRRAASSSGRRLPVRGQSHELRDRGRRSGVVRRHRRGVPRRASRAVRVRSSRDVAVEAVTFRAAALGPRGDVPSRVARAAGDRASVAARDVDGVDVPVYDAQTLASERPSTARRSSSSSTRRRGSTDASTRPCIASGALVIECVRG